MRRLFIPLALLALACTKQKPDWDQVDCQRVNFYQKMYTDSTRAIQIGSDSTLIWPQNGADNQLCGAELQKDLAQMPAGETLCAIDGTTYYLYTYAIIQ